MNIAMDSPGRKQAIAVAAADPNLAEALFHEVSNLTTDYTVKVFHESDDLTQLAGENLLWVFVDAALVSISNAEPILEAEHVVLFNTAAHRREAALLLQNDRAMVRTTIAEHEYLLTEYLFRTVYLPQMKALQSIGSDYLPNRSRAVDPSVFHPVYDHPGLTPAEEADFLAYLQSGIVEDYDRLSNDFVFVSSSTPSSRTGASLKQPPSELREVEAQVRDFARSGESGMSGCFLIGPKGAGKSTLAYYVGLTEDFRTNSVCCIGIDYTMETASIVLGGRMLPLMASLKSNCADLLGATAHHNAVVFRARPLLRAMIERDQYHEIVDLSSEAQLLIETEQDRGLLVQMYCYYVRSGQHAEDAYLDYSDFQTLVDDAERWYESMLSDPRKLFVHYLSYLLERSSPEALETFSYRQIVRHILTTPQPGRSGVEAFAAVGMPEDPYGVAPLEGDTLTPAMVISTCMSLPLEPLRALVNAVLSEIAQGRPLLVLLDNIDQRTSAWLEARLIYGAIRFFHQEILPAFPGSKAIVAMREHTFVSQDWADVAYEATRNWPVAHLKSPDLLTVVHRRCETWQERATGIGDGEHFRHVTDIISWVRQMKRESEERVEGGIPGLMSIIERRYPHNVREQLRSFAKCSTNVLLHREADQRSTVQTDLTPAWLDRSPAFFLRVFLLGDAKFFHEAMSEIPNIYDNETPSSPFNACLR
ncbi:MAG: hypothetical protein WCP21_09440, partial [Armatimonadota bacterium]